MKVLFLTHRLPFAPNRGDRVRAFHIARTLARHAELELVSLAHDADELAQVHRLSELGVRVQAFRTNPIAGYARAALSLTGTRPLTHALLHAAGIGPVLREIARERRPDVILPYCSGMVPFALERPLADIPMVIDFVDVDSAKWASLAESAPWPRRWIYRREARRLGDFERTVARRAAAALVVNERERETLEQLSPGAKVTVVENGVDLAHLQPPSPPSSDLRVIFCGVMNYAPNVEGVLWFAREVWPLIRARATDARFVIVGADPVPAVRRLAEADESIEVTGTVPDVREHLWRAAVSVAPLLTARGLQNKVLEALAAGLPTVVTPTVLDGLPQPARAGCVVAESATTFAEHTIRLLTMNGSERRAVAAQADLSGLSWDARLQPLPGILEAAARSRSTSANLRSVRTGAAVSR